MIKDKALFDNTISEAHKFYFDNFYSPELQIVIDTMEEFDELLDYLEEHHDEADVKLSALSYDITLLIEVFKYKREENWRNAYLLPLIRWSHRSVPGAISTPRFVRKSV